MINSEQLVNPRAAFFIPLPPKQTAHTLRFPPQPRRRFAETAAALEEGRIIRGTKWASSEIFASVCCACLLDTQRCYSGNRERSAAPATASLELTPEAIGGHRRTRSPRFTTCASQTHLGTERREANAGAWARSRQVMSSTGHPPQIRRTWAT